LRRNWTRDIVTVGMNSWTCD